MCLINILMKDQMGKFHCIVQQKMGFYHVLFIIIIII